MNNNRNPPPPQNNNRNPHPPQNNDENNQRPRQPDDIKMNIPSQPEPEVKKPDPPKPKPQQIDYGVEMERINVKDPGSLLFTDETGNRITTYSSHNSVLSTSSWQTVHRAMNKRFDDPEFDLNNKRKCLYSKTGRG